MHLSRNLTSELRLLDRKLTQGNSQNVQVHLCKRQVCEHRGRILYHWVLRGSGRLVIKRNFLFQIEKLLLRNQSPHKAVTDQAYRLQQGLFLASTQQQVFLHGWTDGPCLGAPTFRQNWSIKGGVSINWELHLAPVVRMGGWHFPLNNSICFGCIYSLGSTIQALNNWGLGPVSRKFRNFPGAFSFASSKRRRLEARNFAVIFIFILFTTYEEVSLTE